MRSKSWLTWLGYRLLPNVGFVGPVVGAPFVKNEVMAHAAGRQAFFFFFLYCFTKTILTNHTLLTLCCYFYFFSLCSRWTNGRRQEKEQR